MDIRRQSLKQLAARLNEIVAENERRGWSERNDLPMVVELRRIKGTRRTRTRYLPIAYASSAMLGVGPLQLMTLHAEEADEIKPLAPATSTPSTSAAELKWNLKLVGQRAAWLEQARACDLSSIPHFREVDWVGLPMGVRQALHLSIS